MYVCMYIYYLLHCSLFAYIEQCEHVKNNYCGFKLK